VLAGTVELDEDQLLPLCGNSRTRIVDFQADSIAVSPVVASVTLGVVGFARSQVWTPPASNTNRPRTGSMAALPPSFTPADDP
jgi:hypothetical protein